MWKEFMPGLRMTFAFTALTGLCYPGLVTLLCGALFPDRAGGSLVTRGGKVVGSEWIGQAFTRPEYFHSRPSAAGNDGYDAAASGGSNLGPSSAKLADRVKGAVAALTAENPGHDGPWPSDLALASASGLDPHISPAAARVQVKRVAAARGLHEQQVRWMADRFTEGRDLGLFGEPRVNVLLLNLALDRLSESK